MSLKTLAILTGGGDCPGLNPAIKATTIKALESGLKVLGIKEGWRGLTEDLEPILLTPELVEHIDEEGGTILGTSRTNPFKIVDGATTVKAHMAKLGIDALVAIGGEDTLGVAAKLFEEHACKVVGIPKTIDGDLSATDYTLGLESAVEIISHSIDTLRSTAASHGRIFVVEVMGRHAGHLALKGGISSGATITLIPEVPFQVEHVAKLVLARKNAGARYSIVMVAEGAMPKGADVAMLSGATDSFGHARLGGIGNYLAEALEKITNLETRSVVLSHLQRGGKPAAYDRRMGHYFGIAACEAILSGYFGQMVSLNNGRIDLRPLCDAVKQLRLVDIKKYYDAELYRGKLSVLSQE